LPGAKRFGLPGGGGERAARSPKRRGAFRFAWRIKSVRCASSRTGECLRHAAARARPGNAKQRALQKSGIGSRHARPGLFRV
jgi:hypothetical protein